MFIIYVSTPASIYVHKMYICNYFLPSFYSKISRYVRNLLADARTAEAARQTVVLASLVFQAHFVKLISILAPAHLVSMERLVLTVTILLPVAVQRIMSE